MEAMLIRLVSGVAGRVTDLGIPIPLTQVEVTVIEKEVLFSEVKRGDVICRNHYPYKPFRVVHKVSDRIQLESMDQLTARQRFTPEEFEAARYIKWLPIED